MNPSNTHLLRMVLFADAATCIVTGLGLAAGAGLLAPWLGLPERLLAYAGLSLLPFAAIMLFATRQALSRPAVLAIAAYNALWATDSVLLLIAGWVAPTTLGTAFVLAQAAAVAGFAVLQVRLARPLAARVH